MSVCGGLKAYYYYTYFFCFVSGTRTKNAGGGPMDDELAAMVKPNRCQRAFGFHHTLFFKPAVKFAEPELE